MNIQFKNSHSKHTLTTGLFVALGALLTFNAQAGTAVPYTFTSGTPAKASEVNANFQSLAGAIDNTNANLSTLTSGSPTFSQDINVSGNATIGGDLVGGQATLRMQNSAGEPATASAANAGQLYFDTTSNMLMVSDGTAWRLVTRNRQQLTGNTSVFVPSNNFNVRGSLMFRKMLSTSSLRIGYTDTFAVNCATDCSVKWNVFVDGLPSKLGTTTTFPAGYYVVPGRITGVVTGLAAGDHTIEVHALLNTDSTTFLSIYAEGGPITNFMLEAEELN